MSTWKWIVIMIAHMIFWVIGTVALLPYVMNPTVDFILRANVNYWWFWINMYVSIRIQIALLIPMMERHVHENKPGYLDPYIERLKTWTRSKVLSAG